MTRSSLEDTVQEMGNVELSIHLPLAEWLAMYKAFCQCAHVVDKIEDGSIFKEQRERMQKLRKDSGHFRGLLLSVLNRAAQTDKNESAIKDIVDEHKKTY